MLRRVIPHVAPADNWWAPTLPGWLAIAFTFQGLKALVCPGILWTASLRNSAKHGGAGVHSERYRNNAPSNWEYPLAQRICMSHSPCMRRTSKAWRRYSSERARVGRIFPRSQLLPPEVQRTPRRTKSFLDSKTACHNPHIEEAVKMSIRVMGLRSRPASSLWDTRTNSVKQRQVRIPKYCAGNGTFLAFRKFHTRVLRFVSICGSSVIP